MEAPVRKPFLTQSNIRLESHSDSAAPDDYLIGTIVVGRKVQQKSVASLLMIDRFNLSDTKNDSYHLGLNFSHAPTNEWLLSATLLQTWYRKNTSNGRLTNTENTKLSLAAYRDLKKTEKGVLAAGLTYNTELDFDNLQTTDAELTYDWMVSAKTDAQVGYQYTYNFDIDESFLHQVNAKVSWKLGGNYWKNTKLALEYNLVDPLYKTRGAKPDNDHIFRLGLTRKY